MKIVVLAHYFPPDPHGWIPEDIAQELSSRGHDVKVITTFPHYVTGRIAEGYKQKLHHVETHGRVQVRRVPIIPSHSRNPIGRIANYLSFAWSARMAKKFVEDADVLFVNGAPATVAIPAQAWSKSLGIPYVYHVLDIWPESVTESGFLPRPLADLFKALLNRWLGRVYAGAAAVNAIAPTAQELLIQRGVSSDKCHLVYNWSPESDNPISRDQHRGAGLTLLYAGNLGPLQDLETVIRAAHKLRDREGFRLLVAGSGVDEERLRTLVDELGIGETVQFLGRVDQEQIATLYAEADFQVVPLRNLDFFAGTIPSKFQAGLFHGLPLITTVRGDVTRLVDEHGLGYSAQPENVDSLAHAFQKAYETSAEERTQLSRRAKSFYTSQLSRATAMDRLETILQAAVHARTAVR